MIYTAPSISDQGRLIMNCLVKKEFHKKAGLTDDGPWTFRNCRSNSVQFDICRQRIAAVQTKIQEEVQTEIQEKVQTEIQEEVQMEIQEVEMEIQEEVQMEIQEEVQTEIQEKVQTEIKETLASLPSGIKTIDEVFLFEFPIFSI
jgi:hypothetical protein